jgi:serine protease Do
MNELENNAQVQPESINDVENTKKHKRQKKQKGFGSQLAGVAVKTISFGLIVGFVAGGSVSFGRYYLAEKLTPNTTPQLSTTSISDTIVDTDGADTAVPTDSSAQAVSVDEASANTVEIIKKVKPSIVCITAVSQTTNIFNQTYQSEGSGSGIMFYKDDNKVYIATNNHVIDGA